MITGAYILITLGGVLYLAGWVMLIVTAFRMGIGWGLVVLFLAWLVIPLVIFLVKYWAEARSGFLVMLAGLITAGLGGFVLVGSVATSAMAEFENLEVEPFETTQPMVIEESGGAEAPSAVDESGTPFDDPEWPTRSPVAEEAAEITEEVEPTPTRPPLQGTAGLGSRLNWRPLTNTTDLPGYVGELIELRLQEGEVIRVTLVAVERDVLHVNQRVGGGSMSYAVPMELIKEIHVAK
jgi:hypothetical protein